MYVHGEYMDITKEQYFEFKELHASNMSKAIYVFNFLDREWDAESAKYVLNLYEPIYEPRKY